MNQPAIESARLTTAQASKIFGPILAALLREPDLRPELAELAIKLNGKEMAREMLDVVHKYIRPLKNMRVFSVEVDRERKFEEFLNGLKRIRCDTVAELDQKVLSKMPQHGEKVVDLYLFELPYKVGLFSPGEIMMEYTLRGLQPDPGAHMAFMFGSNRYGSKYLDLCASNSFNTATIWQDANSVPNFISFNSENNDEWNCTVTVKSCEKSYSWRNNHARWYCGVRA